jgi:hypothetical protein
MPDFVRVKVKDTGAHITISRELYETNPDPYTELKSDALGSDGLPAAPEYPDTSATSATSTTTTSKEKS